MSKYLIKIKNLHKHYKKPGFEVRALDGVDIKVEKGEFIALVGPSGSGKSTLMNVVGCLDTPTSGEYILNSQDVSGLSDNKLAKIRNQELGFVFQNFNLMGNISTLENVALPGKYRKMKSSECRKLAKAALAKVGLSDRMKHLPSELSGGQQQRAAFARALLCNPPLLLADEPTGNLDSKTGDEVLRMIKELNEQGTTIIMVTHSKEIADIAGRTIELLDGKIVADTAKEAAK